MLKIKKRTFRCPHKDIPLERVKTLKDVASHNYDDCKNCPFYLKEDKLKIYCSYAPKSEQELESEAESK